MALPGGLLTVFPALACRPDILVDLGLISAICPTWKEINPRSAKLSERDHCARAALRRSTCAADAVAVTTVGARGATVGARGAAVEQTCVGHGSFAPLSRGGASPNPSAAARRPRPAAAGAHRHPGPVSSAGPHAQHPRTSLRKLPRPAPPTGQLTDSCPEKLGTHRRTTPDPGSDRSTIGEGRRAPHGPTAASARRLGGSTATAVVSTPPQPGRRRSASPRSAGTGPPIVDLLPSKPGQIAAISPRSTGRAGRSYRVAYSAIRPSSPLRNRGESSVDIWRASSTASVMATASSISST